MQKTMYPGMESNDDKVGSENSFQIILQTLHLPRLLDYVSEVATHTIHVSVIILRPVVNK